MPNDRISSKIQSQVDILTANGARKGLETVFETVVDPAAGKGPRFTLKSMGDRKFLRMNSKCARDRIKLPCCSKRG